MPVLFVEELSAELAHGYSGTSSAPGHSFRIANREKALCRSLNSPGR